MVTLASSPTAMPGGIGAGDAAAQDDNLGGGHAWDTAQQDASAALLAFQTMGADLDGHAAGNLTHRCQQWQSAGAVGDGFIGDASGAGLHQPLGLGLVGGEVEVGEQDLTGPQHGDFGGLRFLDLNDQVGRLEQGGRRVGNRCAGRSIGVVTEADAGSGIMFDADGVAELDEFPDAGRGQTDAVFMGLDLFRNADFHEVASCPLTCPERPCPSRVGGRNDNATGRCFL